MKKNVLIAVGAASFFAFVGAALAADAMPSSLMMMHPPRPMVLTVASNGHALLRGVVKSVSGNSISVATWGGIWTVTTDVSTSVTQGSVGDVAAGDFIGVIGTVSEDSPTLAASVIHDWTSHSAMMHDNSMMHEGAMTGTSSMSH